MRVECRRHACVPLGVRERDVQVDKTWSASSDRPYDPPLTKHGEEQVWFILQTTFHFCCRSTVLKTRVGFCESALFIYGVEPGIYARVPCMQGKLQGIDLCLFFSLMGQLVAVEVFVFKSIPHTSAFAGVCTHACCP